MHHCAFWQWCKFLSLSLVLKSKIIELTPFTYKVKWA